MSMMQCLQLNVYVQMFTIERLQFSVKIKYIQLNICSLNVDNEYQIMQTIKCIR